LGKDNVFLQKEGMYLHGVFWIGEDLEEGKEKTDLAAKECNDDYHNWCLVEYKEQDDYTTDADDNVIYRVDA